MGDIKISGFSDLDTKKARALIAQEWQERKGDKENPGGYGPSVEFGEFSQTLQARKSKLTDELREYAKNEEAIPKSRIDDLKQLECLCHEAATSPNSDRRNSGLRDIRNGKNPYQSGGITEWKRFENIAARLEKSHEIESRIQVSHHEL